MVVYVALLRGINVSGQKIIKMEDLRSCFKELGYFDARTYVQSGNIVFSSAVSTEEELSSKIGGKILRDHRFPVAVFIRGSSEIARIVRANPFLKDQGIDPAKLYVTFLSDSPAKSLLPKMNMLNAAPDEFRILGREVYLHCPNGYGRSKFSNNTVEKALSVKATTRNWNTVSTLAEMSSEHV